MKLAWTPKSIRAFKGLIRKNPQLRSVKSSVAFCRWRDTQTT